MAIIDYTPPPTIKDFILDYRQGELFYDWVVGPVGSGKTTGNFFKLVYLAQQQAPSPDGVRRTRAVIVRNTMPQLKDTTLVSWGYWFQDGVAGSWKETDKKFTLRFGDVECVVMFRPLDTEDDIARVLSLEINFAIIDEFVEIPRKIVEALSARLGRFKLPDGTKPTTWGMWGSSNPSTEDNWWYDYLHRSSADPQQNMPDNARYFLQPSGLSPEAENLDNLPGGRDYYVNQAKGKSEAWVRQFIHAEWGFSASGQPVVATFKPDMHIAKTPLLFNPALPLVIGLDPGIEGSALVFGQEDLHGRLLVLGEMTQANYGARRLIEEKLRPYLKRNFPDADVVIAPDPASANRAQTDERAVVDEFRKYFKVKIETNNRLAKRLDAIEAYTTKLTGAGPGLLVDVKQCPQLIRALRGGWRYVIDTKKSTNKPEPEKNAFSHVGDGFGYLCRYFHSQFERDSRYRLLGPEGRPVFSARKMSPRYHFR